MKSTFTIIKIKDLCKNYRDDGDGGVFGYDNRLTIRPAYQREFVYNAKQRDAVIETIQLEMPLHEMTWAVSGKNENGETLYEVLDGQQRTISIAQYLNGDYAVMWNGNPKYYWGLTPEEKDLIDNYELHVDICDGTDIEKLMWFQRINIAGAVLTNQELLNATYSGTWLTDAKTYFSKRNCWASKYAGNYIKKDPLRQELLELALKWICNRNGLSNVKDYMAIHQNDIDANDLYIYFKQVIDWAKTYFPKFIKGMHDKQDWGVLYNKYHDNTYNVNTLTDEINELLKNDEITKPSGIIEYLLSNKENEKVLSIRAFTENQKLTAYAKQNGICPLCNNHYEYDEMDGDHITAWSNGGKTTDDNLQMLCRKCNCEKSNKKYRLI